MSILENTQNVQVPAAPPVRPIRKRQRANTVINGARQTAEMIALNLIKGLDAIWHIDPAVEEGKPQDVLDVLGTDAVELFALSRDTGAYIIPQLTGKRDDLVAMINEAFDRVLPYTEHEDGTVTVDEEPEE